jgi:hypothetical protein
VVDEKGNQAEGWGETPLSVQWVWPSALPYQQRHDALTQFVENLAPEWLNFGAHGHALTIGHDFQRQVLPRALAASRSAEFRSAGFQPAVSPTSSRQGVAGSVASVPLNASQARSPAIQQTGSLRYGEVFET